MIFDSWLFCIVLLSTILWLKIKDDLFMVDGVN